MKNNRTSADVGMRTVFWAWMALIIVGLTVMIVFPLTGR